MTRKIFALVGVGALTSGLWCCGSDAGLERSGNTNQAAGSGSTSETDGTGSTARSGPSAGGSASNPPRNVTITSVPGQSVISELTVEEVARVCAELQNAAVELLDSQRSLLCTMSALTSASATDTIDPSVACQAAYDACMAQPVQVADPTNCSNASQDAATCEATVDEINECLDAVAGLEQLLGSSLSCELDNAAALLAVATLQPPVSCQIIEAKCPDGFF